MKLRVYNPLSLIDQLQSISFPLVASKPTQQEVSASLGQCMREATRGFHHRGFSGLEVNTGDPGDTFQPHDASKEVLRPGEERQTQHGRLQPASFLHGLVVLQVERVCLLGGRSDEWEAVVVNDGKECKGYKHLTDEIIEENMNRCEMKLREKKPAMKIISNKVFS